MHFTVTEGYFSSEDQAYDEIARRRCPSQFTFKLETDCWRKR